MILDSSAIVAIIAGEPTSSDLVVALARAGEVGIGTPTLLETSLVLTARIGPHGRMLVERLLDQFGVVRVPFDDDHGRVAFDAFLRFGKGRHPAALNFGDCMTFATARIAGRPLLCVGDDFPWTDLALVTLPTP